MNAEILIRQAIPLVKEVGGFIRQELINFDHRVTEIKSPNQLVTHVDINSEKMLVERLRATSPDAGFITEEDTVKDDRDADIVWIIDPLDGTTNFVHKLPVFSVSVGLMIKGKLAGGIVYEVNQDECFFAWEGGPAYLNSNEIRVSQSTELGDSLLATGFPYYDYDRIDDYIDLLKVLMRNTRGLRRMGSAAVDLAYVACGRFDGFFEYSLSPWDVAAGAFIVQQAGGKVQDFSGGDNFIFGNEIVAGCPGIYEPFMTEVKKAFN